MIAHIFTTLLTNNFFSCCCFCRSAFTVGAFPVPSCEEYWRGKGKDCKRFAFMSDFSCQSCVPQSFPRAATMHHYCQCDCSYRLPSRYYLFLPLQGDLRLLGDHFYWSRHKSKVLPRTVKAIESPDWTQDFVLWKMRFWWWHGASLTLMYLSGYERSHESRCWVGGNGGKRGVQKHKEGTKQKCMDDSELAEFMQESCWTGLFRTGWGQESRVPIDNTAGTLLSENKRWFFEV